MQAQIRQSLVNGLSHVHIAVVVSSYQTSKGIQRGSIVYLLAVISRLSGSTKANMNLDASRLASFLMGPVLLFLLVFNETELEHIQESPNLDFFIFEVPVHAL